MDVMAGITLPWGVESFVNALATLSGEEEVVEREADNVEETEGRLDILWEFGLLPQGDLLLNVEIMDASGNVHSHQQEVHPDDHEHDHGGIMITSGSLWLLAVVVGGVFAGQARAATITAAGTVQDDAGITAVCNGFVFFMVAPCLGS